MIMVINLLTAMRNTRNNPASSALFKRMINSVQQKMVIPADVQTLLKIALQPDGPNLILPAPLRAPSALATGAGLVSRSPLDP